MINIANLLRNTKKGTILWSPLFGPVEFMQLGKNDQIWVRVDNSEPFDKYGRYFGSRFPEAECQLFPSNKVRSWVGWTPPVEPKFKPKQWVLVRDCDNQTWGLSRFSHMDMGCYICINREDFSQCIPFEGNENLLGTTNMCPEHYITWE